MLQLNLQAQFCNGMVDWLEFLGRGLKVDGSSLIHPSTPPPPQLLRAQKKAVKRELVAREEAERRRLSTVLQVQHLLHSLQQEHIRKDLLSGHNQAPHLPAHKLHSLLQLAALLGVKRDSGLR